MCCQCNADEFSLHAGLDIQPHQREKIVRLCRYVSRSAVAVKRLAHPGRCATR
jgi:hypothetical protein